MLTKKLKELRLTIVDISEYLGYSRQMMYTYIGLYESNKHYKLKPEILEVFNRIMRYNTKKEVIKYIFKYYKKEEN